MRPRVLKEAEAELLAAMLWYEERQVGLGEAFYERVTETMQAIAKDSFRFPLYEGLPLERERQQSPGSAAELVLSGRTKRRKWLWCARASAGVVSVEALSPSLTSCSIW